MKEVSEVEAGEWGLRGEMKKNEGGGKELLLKS